MAKVLELVYSNPSAAYSAQGTNVYQVIYSSPGLTDEDRTVIEDKVEDYAVSAEDEPRLQSFALGGGRRVVARSRRLAPDNEYGDERGGFVARVWIIRREDFAATGDDPFPWLDALELPETAKAVAEAYGPASRRPAEIEVQPVFPKEEIDPGPWTGSNLGNLVALAAAAPAAAAEPIVAILGPAPARIRTLRLALKATPRLLRHACTFDSETGLKPSWTPGFWAIGLRELSRSSNQAQMVMGVDAVRGSLAGQLPEPTAAVSKDLYGRWVLYAARGNSLPEDFYALASEVETYAAAIQVDGVLPEAARPAAELAKELVKLWQPELSAAASARLEQWAGKRASGMLLPWLNEHAGAANLLQVAWAHERGGMKELGPLAAEWLLASHPKLNDGEWRQLAGLAEKAGAPLLAAIAGVFTKDAPRAGSRSSPLECLGPEDYRRLLAQAPEWIEPRKLASVSHGKTMVAWLAQQQLRPDEFGAVVQDMLECGAGEALQTLSSRILKLPPRWHSKLAAIIPASGIHASPFTRRLLDQLAATPPPVPWWKKIFQRDPRSSRKGKRRR